VPARRKGAPDAEGGSPRLKGYSAKRDFERTPEPVPRGRRARARAPRFVIHEHHARRLHWDLRLEHDGVLASWALPRGLPPEPGENRFAAHTEDHPLDYVDFQGEIPAGQYGAGEMSIWDAGTFELLKWEPRKVEVALHGKRVNARYALFSIDKGAEDKDWMIHRMDPPDDPAREPMPSSIVPMLARSGELPEDERGWAFEIKWDGVRAIAYCEPGRVRLQSRNLNDITASYPELGRLARALGARSAVLDGEIVAFDARGRPSFETLQQRMHVSSASQAGRLARQSPATYVIFDLLWLDGRSLMALPYRQRRELLAGLGLAGASWQTPENMLGGGTELLGATAAQGLEGIIAKRLDSDYQPGLRTRSWLKVKSFGRQEFVVGGWMPGKGRRAGGVGALLLGVYERGGTLRYVGRVGSGFSEPELDRLQALLAPLQRDTSPFNAGARPPRDARFCEPELVVEVQFSEWTRSGSVRQPSYKGLREDKPAAEVVREDLAVAQEKPSPTRQAPTVSIRRRGSGGVAEVEGRELKLSNLAKVLYPESGFTKGELIAYYAAVAPVLLGHLQGRPLTVTRWPDGVLGKSFFQKQAPAHRPDWVRTATVPSGRKSIDYTLADDLPTLLWLANLAAIELHTPLARAPEMRRPTALVFDLDPGAPASVIECCRVALKLQGMFEHLGLQSHAKTSGSKGLQVYVPLNSPGVAYEHTKPFARTVAELLEHDDPDLVVSRMAKARRAGKVLIDWSQNDRNKTTICAYSLRPAARPTASTPVAWEEVRGALLSGRAEDLAFEAGEVLRRVAERGDLFAPVLSLVQELPAFG